MAAGGHPEHLTRVGAEPQVGERHQTHEIEPGVRDGSPPPFLSIDERENAGHLAAAGLDGFGSLQGRPPSGDDIFHHNDRVTRFEAAFDPPPSRMGFRLFPNGECIDGPSRLLAGLGYGIRHGVSPQRHPAHGRRIPSLPLDGLPTQYANNPEAFATHRRPPTVDVVPGLLPG